MSPRIIAFSALFTLLATPAFAQGRKDEPAAQSLFNEARSLMKKGKYTEACPKLEESLRMDYGIGTEFNLADCNEHVGKTATAWSQFLSVAAAAKSKGQSDREQIARKRAAALEPQLARLVVEVQNKTEGLEVTRDEISLGTAVWGTAVPVDPGTHRVVARAPGKKPWESNVEVTAAHTVRVVVPGDLTPFVADAKKGAAAPVAIVAPPVTPAEPGSAQTTTTTTSYDFPEPIDESRGQTQRVLGWVATGLGVAGLGASAGLGLASLSDKNASDPYCQGNVCDQTGKDYRDRAYDRGNAATYTGLAGGVLAVTGIVLIATAPSAREERTVGHASSKPASRNTAVGLGPTGFIVRGSF